MDAYLLDWANLLVRWAHLIAGIAWIGASFYFVMLDNSLKPPKNPADAKRGVFGELWAVHGGGFYHSQKYLTGPKGELHPVQKAMVDNHGSQCGFCTPGFAVSLAVAHLNGDTAHDDVLAGNLCRCTGYAPIHRAAVAAESTPVPAWIKADAGFLLTQIPPRGAAPGPPVTEPAAPGRGFCGGTA